VVEKVRFFLWVWLDGGATCFMVRFSRIPRVVRKVLIFLIIAWVGVWVIASIAAPYVVEAVMPKVTAKARSMGVVIERVNYEKVRVSPFLNAVSAEKITIDFDLAPDDPYQLSSSFRCEKVEVELHNLFKLRGAVRVSGFDVKFHQADMPQELPFDSFTEGEVYLANLPLLSPREAVRQLLADVVRLFNKNELSDPFEFSGKVQIRVKQKSIPAKIYSERHDESYRLRFSEEDIRVVAKEMGILLSDDQVDMVSLYPLRIPLVSTITERARNMSLRYYDGDHWKQDALRHTLWSFMLTRAFGPEFALIATDAQEAKPGNEHYERLMDYNNNAVGRAFAAENVALSQIPRLVLEDPRVVLNPNDAKYRPKGQLLK